MVRAKTRGDSWQFAVVSRYSHLIFSSYDAVIMPLSWILFSSTNDNYFSSLLLTLCLCLWKRSFRWWARLYFNSSPTRNGQIQWTRKSFDALSEWSAFSLSLLVNRIVYQILFILSEPISAAKLHPLSVIDSLHEDADKLDLEKGGDWFLLFWFDLPFQILYTSSLKLRIPISFFCRSIFPALYDHSGDCWRALETNSRSGVNNNIRYQHAVGSQRRVSRKYWCGSDVEKW